MLGIEHRHGEYPAISCFTTEISAPGKLLGPGLGSHPEESPVLRGKACLWWSQVGTFGQQSAGRRALQWIRIRVMQWGMCECMNWSPGVLLGLLCVAKRPDFYQTAERFWAW